MIADLNPIQFAIPKSRLVLCVTVTLPVFLPPFTVGDGDDALALRPPTQTTRKATVLRLAHFEVCTRHSRRH